MLKIITNLLTGAACQCVTAVITQHQGVLTTVNVPVDATYTQVGPYLDTSTRAMRLLLGDLPILDC